MAVFLSLRQLKGILKQRGLCRRRNRSNPRVVCDAIEQELYVVVEVRLGTD